MRYLPLLLLGLLPLTYAEETPLRPSARLLFKHPQFLQAGQCVAYREGGSGWIVTDPVFYLKGEVLRSHIQTRRLKTCPEVPGKNLNQYSREEFNRYSRAYPCLTPGEPEQDIQLGIVSMRVKTWETPHARQMANAGRLYRGQFIDQPLTRDLEIELEADLLSECN